MWAAAFACVHVALALVIRTVPGLATLHAIATLVFALVFTATTRHIQRVAIPLAYLAGCEVLWRMTKAGVFWEYGKYSMDAVMLLAILRLQKRRNLLVSAMYFGLLIPSVVLSYTALGLSGARDEISFVLSGPFTIACAVVFFSSIRLTTGELRTTFVALLGPIAAVSLLVFLKLEKVSSLQFVNASNSVASGGFGPNQVSAILGLAMMILILLAMDRGLPTWLRLLFLAPATLLAFQTTLTFARGGIMLALAGSFAAMFALFRANRRARMGVITIAAVSYLVGTYIVQPKLDAITENEVTLRYSNFQSSGRDTVIDSELSMFFGHPVLGVGPGVGSRMRLEKSEIGPSHTEYSRMLGEHGILGALSLFCLLVIVLRAVLQARDPDARALALALIVWSTLFLAIYATRLAAPAFVLGLAYVAPRSSSLPRKTAS